MPPSRLISGQRVAVAPAHAMGRTALFPWAVGPRSAPSPAQEAERSVDRLAIIAAGRLIAEGTPGSLKVQDHGQLRLQVMLVPGMDTPMLPGWVRHHTGSATI
jgi:hypothetical protein